MTLPKQYQWLEAEPGPRILKEMLKLLGTEEAAGSADNPTILWWARAIGLASVYRDDAIPWCGLVMGYVAGQAGWETAPRGNALWARNWAFWGAPVAAGEEELGDVLVFARKGGGHVGLYVGEDEKCFHVLGGNQSNAVNIKRLDRKRLLAARRCPWRISAPANLRKVTMAAAGPLSSNEA